MYLLRDQRVGAARACPGRVPVLVDSVESRARAPKGALFQPEGDELFIVCRTSWSAR